MSMIAALHQKMQDPKSLRTQLIRGGLGSAGIHAANRVVMLGLSIVLARTLGVEGYGIFAYTIAIMSLISVVAEAGVPTLLMREVATSHGRQEWGLLRGVLRRSMQFVGVVASGVSLFGLLILWLIADGLEPQMLYTTALMLLMLPVVVLCKTVAYAMRGLRRVVLGQALDMLLRPLLVFAFVGVIFLMWPGLREAQYAMAAQLLAVSVVLMVGILMLRRLVPIEARTTTAEYRDRDWLKSALPFTLIGGAGVINNQTDIIMLGWFISAEEVGIYRVAVQGATLVAFSLQVANSVVAPQFSRLYAQADMARLQHLVTQSARVILLLALPVALAFILAGATIVVRVFGTDFAAAYTPLAILAAGQLINAGFGSVGFLLNMTGYERITARILWQTAVLNIVLNAMLIPLFAMIGAAIATAISLVCWNTLLYYQVHKRLGISSIALKIGAS